MKTTFSLKELEYWLLCLGIYSSVFIESLILLLVVLLILSRKGRAIIQFEYVAIFGSIFLWSIVTIMFLNYTPYKFFQQFVLLNYFVLFYYIIFYNCDIQKIFSVYIKLSFILCISALAQFCINYLFGINIFSFFSHAVDASGAPMQQEKIMRVSSICAEPSNFSRLITPAFGYYFLKNKNTKEDRIKFSITSLALFLTFSTMSYLIVLCMIVYKYLIFKSNKIVRYVSVVVLVIFSVILFNIAISSDNNNNNRKEDLFSGISMRIGDVISGFKDLDPQSLELLNLSSYATMTNVWVAINADNRITGTGLGTHEQNYESKYQSDFKYYGLNKQEGYALGNRLYSEFGLVGIMLFVLFLFKYHKKDEIINICAFFVILTLIFRGGHYTRYGTVFFFYLYYYSSKFKNINEIN